MGNEIFYYKYRFIIRVIVIGVLDCFIFIVLYDLDLILFGFYFLGDF